MKPSPVYRLAVLLAALALAAAGCGSPGPAPAPAPSPEPSTPPAAAEATGESPAAGMGQESTAAPAPVSGPAGQIVFQDDFSSSSPTWLPVSPERQAGELLGGAFRLAVDNVAAPGLISVRPAGQDLGDVSLEADLQLESPPGLGGAGFVCRYQDPGSYYAFLVDGINVEIIRMDQGQAEILVYDLPSPAIHPVQNHLEVSCTGSLLKISVNGQEVAFINDYTLSSGDVGLAAGGSGEGSTVVFFDNFRASGFSPDNSSVAQAPPAPPVPPTPAPGAGGRSVVDPCELLTKADAEEILGQEVGEPEIAQRGPFQECLYNTLDDGLGMLGIQVQTGVAVEVFDLQADQAASFMEVELVPVEGVGDKAYWFLGILQVLKGDVYYQYLAFLPGSEEENLRISIELGKRAAERLP